MFSRVLQSGRLTSSMESTFIKYFVGFLFSLMFCDLFYQKIEFNRRHTLRKASLIRTVLNVLKSSSFRKLAINLRTISEVSKD